MRGTHHRGDDRMPGVGPKTAAKLLAEFGSIDQLYQRLDDVARPKLRQA